MRTRSANDAIRCYLKRPKGFDSENSGIQIQGWNRFCGTIAYSAFKSDMEKLKTISWVSALLFASWSSTGFDKLLSKRGNTEIEEMNHGAAKCFTFLFRLQYNMYACI